MKIRLILVLVTGGLLLSGCAASGNFYSGRTLEEGKYSVGFGLDDIAIKSTDKSFSVSKSGPFVPSIGGAAGLPWRFELGMKYYLGNLFGVSLRHQVNPRSFDIVDLSLNLHYDLRLGQYSDLRYGFTLSKNIHEFEPYVHYTAFYFLESTTCLFDNSFITGAVETYVNSNRCIGVGIALPAKKAKLYLEVNHQYFGGDIKHGILHFGIGLRVFPG